jgi:glutaredoxin
LFIFIHKEVLILNYILYTIDGCYKCHQARKFLEKEGIAYQEKNILEDCEAARQIKEITGEIITPVLVAGDDVLIGEEILSLKEGEKIN